MTDAIDKLLVGGGALWASVAVHGLIAVGAGVLDRAEEPPIQITLIEPAAPEPDGAPPEEGAPVEAPSSGGGEPPSAMEGAPAPAEEGARSSGPRPAEADDEDLHWRARLRRDEARYAASQREEERRLAWVARYDRAPRDEARGGGGSDPGSPGSGSAQAIRRCQAGGPGDELPARPTRDLGRLAPILPGGILPDAYLEQIGELGWSRDGGRLAFDLALPAELLPIRLEEPDLLVAVGRTDARCAVRITVGPDLFPLHLLGLPVRVVDDEGRVQAALADVSLGVDATAEVLAVRQGALGLEEGRLWEAEELSARMRDHQSIFRTLKALSGE